MGPAGPQKMLEPTYISRHPLTSEAPSSLFPPTRALGNSDPFNLQRRLSYSPQNSIYEMAAFTQELNTLQITSRVREVLAANNIGQKVRAKGLLLLLENMSVRLTCIFPLYESRKVFGDAVLGLSQGSVSELLTRPKPWHMLSIKGREPFIRMHLWLNDPLRVEKLLHYKEDSRNSLKHKLLVDSASTSGSPPPNSSIKHIDDDSPIVKRPRVQEDVEKVTSSQEEALKIAFAMGPSPGPPVIDFLSKELGLDPSTVTHWFESTRANLRDKMQDQDNERSPREAPVSPPTTATDPDNDKEVDLSHQPSDGENDEDEDDEASRQSNGVDKGQEDTEEVNASVLHYATTAAGRSRRKPLAPQWVNPDAEHSSNDLCLPATGHS